jgi:hypothetical protein
MTSKPIYPYIPFACALVWNRSQADASPVKVHASFTPDWFAARMNLDMGERWHVDPAYRRDSFVAMGSTLNAEFPQLRLGGSPEEIRGGISQIHSCAPVAALFGQDVVHASSGWPENRRVLLDDRAADALQIPDFESSPMFVDLMRQMDEIQMEWGEIDGELNYQGVLNTAFRLRGEQIFVDMVLAPERAHHVLGVVCETTIRFADAVYQRQARTGVIKDYFVTSNCVVNMISEQSYRQFIMPYDRKLSDHFPNFGVHNCGWKVDAYAKAYSEIRPLGYLDFGIESNLDLLKTLFPTTILTLILNPGQVIGRSPADIRHALARLRNSLGTCRIDLSALDARTPSEEVSAFFQATAEVWGVPIQSLVPRPHFG